MILQLFSSTGLCCSISTVKTQYSMCPLKWGHWYIQPPTKPPCISCANYSCSTSSPFVLKSHWRRRDHRVSDAVLPLPCLLFIRTTHCCTYSVSGRQRVTFSRHVSVDGVGDRCSRWQMRQMDDFMYTVHTQAGGCAGKTTAWFWVTLMAGKKKPTRCCHGDSITDGATDLDINLSVSQYLFIPCHLTASKMETRAIQWKIKDGNETRAEHRC